ncbi:MAG: hypothetical protein WDO68_09060 [Gammaproteobacteria bacterium]
MRWSGRFARLSQSQTAESLAADVFSTFPSLYHLLPTSTAGSGQDFFDEAAWPANGPQPNLPLLKRARAVLSALAQGDRRFVNIIGAGQETVTRATRRNGQFIYTITRKGDGTVPVAFAELPGARTYYTTVAHSDLARDAAVAQAIADVLRTGETARLRSKWSSGGRAEARISDTQLRRTHTGKVDFAQMEPEVRQAFLRNLNDPPQLKLSVPGAKAKGKRAAAKRSSRPKTSLRKPRAAPRVAKPSRRGSRKRVTTRR